MIDRLTPESQRKSKNDLPLLFCPPPNKSTFEVSNFQDTLARFSSFHHATFFIPKKLPIFIAKVDPFRAKFKAFEGHNLLTAFFLKTDGHCVLCLFCQCISPGIENLWRNTKNAFVYRKKFMNF